MNLKSSAFLLLASGFLLASLPRTASAQAAADPFFTAHLYQPLFESPEILAAVKSEIPDGIVLSELRFQLTRGAIHIKLKLTKKFVFLGNTPLRFTITPPKQEVEMVMRLQYVAPNSFDLLIPKVDVDHISVDAFVHIGVSIFDKMAAKMMPGALEVNYIGKKADSDHYRGAQVRVHPEKLSPLIPEGLEMTDLETRDGEIVFQVSNSKPN